MPLIMTHAQWMSGTHSRIKRRSDELTSLDIAIQQRSEAGAKQALVIWIDGQNKKRQDWQKSVRNRKGTVKTLYDQLGVLGSSVPYNNITAEMDDKLAKADIRHEQRIAAAKMFADRELAFKFSFVGAARARSKQERAKINKARAKAGIKVGGMQATPKILSVASNIKKSIDLILQTVPPETHKSIIEIVFGESVQTFVSEAAPVIGIISSGLGATMAWAGVAANLNAQIQLIEASVSIRPGDPTAALQAMDAVIEREIKYQTAEGVIKTTAFAAKTAAAAADFGTATTVAIGTVESVASLLNLLVDIVIDVRQITAGNKALKSGQLGLELFNTCPILGCYYIVVQDHSTIMNFEIENMGKDNWRQEAERLRYAIQPVLAKGSKLINKSRIEIRGMADAKGVYRSTILQKIKIMYKSKGYGQVSKDVTDIFEA